MIVSDLSKSNQILQQGAREIFFFWRVTPKAVYTRAARPRWEGTPGIRAFLRGDAQTVIHMRDER